MICKWILGGLAALTIAVGLPAEEQRPLPGYMAEVITDEIIVHVGGPSGTTVTRALSRGDTLWVFSSLSPDWVVIMLNEVDAEIGRRPGGVAQAKHLRRVGSPGHFRSAHSLAHVDAGCNASRATASASVRTAELRCQEHDAVNGYRGCAVKLEAEARTDCSAPMKSRMTCQVHYWFRRSPQGPAVPSRAWPPTSTTMVIRNGYADFQFHVELDQALAGSIVAELWLAETSCELSTLEELTQWHDAPIQ